MFEMVPAQPLAPGSWAQLLSPGSWCARTASYQFSRYVLSLHHPLAALLFYSAFRGSLCVQGWHSVRGSSECCHYTSWCADTVTSSAARGGCCARCAQLYSVSIRTRSRRRASCAWSCSCRSAAWKAAEAEQGVSEAGAEPLPRVFAKARAPGAVGATRAQQHAGDALPRNHVAQRVCGREGACGHHSPVVPVQIEKIRLFRTVFCVSIRGN